MQTQFNDSRCGAANFSTVAGGALPPEGAAQHRAQTSVKAAAAEVVGDDDVSDGVEDKLDVVGVGGARVVAVDLLRLAAVLLLELCLDEHRRLLVRLLSCHGRRDCF